MRRGRRPHREHRRDERGQTSLLIVGFAVVAAMLVAAVVDASAAYLQRQSLDSLADGAALAGADGVQGEQVYTSGLDDTAAIDPAVAQRYVAQYLAATGAQGEYPGLSYSVSADGEAVVVRVAAPMDLPLSFAGVGESTLVTATAASYVVVRP